MLVSLRLKIAVRSSCCGGLAWHLMVKPNMPLQSELFQGDPNLEACLVNNAAHVTPDASGDHVGKIQVALLTLEDVDIDSGELSTQRYGSSTANAVLTYKRKRNIINFSYQTHADNIVGKMTISSLDREMLAQEVPDDSDACFLDDALIAGQAGAGGESGSGVLLGFAVSASVLPVTAAGLTPSDRAKSLKADAAAWAAAATSSLGLVAGMLASPDPNDPDAVKRTTAFLGLETHFHISTHPNPAAFVSELSKFYSFIQITISRAANIFVDDLTNTSDFAFAFPGGFHADPAQARGQLHFCPQYLKLGNLMATAVIVHESAHYADRTIGHFASELPPFAGSAVGTGHTKNYAQLNADEAKQNAYSYAQFALHMFKRFDKRLKFRRLPGGGLQTD
jgi:hypothetical protein